MRNSELARATLADEALAELLTRARMEERKNQHLSVSMRLTSLTIHAQRKGMSVSEVLELFRKESERFEHSAQELI
ncbi:hypothetical protein Dda3937_04480 [Dickeya dadantii 3937]|uniref:DUF2732 family protein n=1 Tax=Dickeya dadantii (strain 3937) TaxID=198628 RepID=E0SAM0_DICD3|nr:DUF2732 domain-containing protein [Dickeya dadantii]ADM97078.1 hypothetical protein Dda3937_04480 [Dickeya dadantii 3937]